MRQRPGLRLFVVSDRNDKKVSYRSQLEFVERVKAHNLPITHITATATDKDSHGLFAHGHRLAVDCANLEREAERTWAVSKDTTTIAVLEEFVRRYGDSHYATLARARMEELRKSQAAAQTTVPPGFDSLTITVKEGESAATILRDYGAAAEDIRALTAVLGARGRDGGLRDGQKLRILFATDAGRTRAVRVEVVGDSAIEAVVELSDTGKYVWVAPGASSGVLAPSNPNPLQLAPPASQPKIFSDRVGQPPTQSDTAQPANSPGSGPVAATLEPKRVKTVTIRSEVASRPTAAAPECAYVVHVSSQRTEEEAKSSYRALQQKYPAVLGSREVNIRRVDLGDMGGIFYRAEVGSFVTSEQATAFCGNLKTAGWQCIVRRCDGGGPGPGQPPAASLRGGSAIAESSEATKYENKKPETPPDAAKPPVHTADTLTRGVAIVERGCKARFHGLASEGLAADCAKEVDDAAPTARYQTETPPSARGREVLARPQPVSAEPRERERKAAEPRRASVERPSSKPARAPRQAKPRGSGGRCFALGGRSFCE